ncbi:MAG: hypothetical protein ACREMR_09305 [Gemmatimonadales bacterium]
MCSLVVCAAMLTGVAAAAAQAGGDTVRTVDSAASGPLLREQYSYEGGGRDPFRSLMRADSDMRPLIADLKLVAVIYDTRYPARSVAVLRDITNGRRYRVRSGEIVGRLKITQIRPREIVFTVQEFGFERQETLALRKQEATP